jgi:hypothetical protein
MSNPHNGPPKEVEGRTTPHHQGGQPSTSQTNQLHSHAADASHSSRTRRQTRVCRAAPRRRRPEQEPAAQIRGAVAAAEHLLDLGYTPLFDPPTLQALWAAGHWRLVERLGALTGRDVA